MEGAEGSLTSLVQTLQIAVEEQKELQSKMSANSVRARIGATFDAVVRNLAKFTPVYGYFLAAIKQRLPNLANVLPRIEAGQGDSRLRMTTSEEMGSEQ